MNKKLQIFVSSTYTDLIEERQTVVEAILETGHIPAGMELFSANNVEQFKIIKKWIDKSDIVILILGGKYGSIESSSGKSYIELEYEYATKIGKKPITIVMNDDLIQKKIILNCYNHKQPEYLSKKYISFKNKILKNNLCDFFSNKEELKNCIYRSIHMIEENIDDFAGWIPYEVLKKMQNEYKDLPFQFNWEEQKFTFRYLDINKIEVINDYIININVNGYQYFTDRFTWTYGGKIKIESLLDCDKMIDSFDDMNQKVFTLRLSKRFNKGETLRVCSKISINNFNSNNHMFFGRNYTSLGCKKLSIIIETPPDVQLKNGIFKTIPGDIYSSIPTSIEELTLDDNTYKKILKNEIVSNINYVIE